MEQWQPVDLTTDPHDARFSGDPAELLDAVAELLEAFRRPDWHQSASCLGQGPAMFFPERGQSFAPARALCQGCPVRADCRAAALGDDSLQGFWGGESHGERQRRRGPRAAA